MEVLPDYTPVTEEVLNPPWLETAAFRGRYWPTLTTPNGDKCVDAYSDGEDIIAVIWKFKDHPNIAKLPSNAPRAVKALYKASSQEAQLKSKDYFTMPSTLAQNAWDKYWLSNRKQSTCAISV